MFRKDTLTNVCIHITGENGRGVQIDKKKLSRDELEKYEAGFKQHAFNQYASDMMSIHRSLLDVRDPR